MKFPFIEIEGTPYELGFQHGAAFKTQVQRSVACYQEMFRDYSDLSWDRAKLLSRRFIPMIEAYNADYLEEIRGVADGSGFTFEDILALNCRSELVWVGKEFDKIDGGCTTVAVNTDAGREGHAFLGHNWDWKTSQRDSLVTLKLHQKNGKPTIFTITEAGIIGKTGLNSAGLCLTLNALSTDQAPVGLPLHIAMRGILDCETLAEAVGAATAMPLGCCANFMLGHKNGECIDVESENGDFDVLYPRDGILAHTNHFVSPRLPTGGRKDTTKYKLPDSFIRLGRADRLLRKKGTEIGPEDIMEVLRDHVEYPAGICRHDDPKVEPGLRVGTVFSIVVDLTEGTLLLCPGNPCDTPYEPYQI